MVTEPSEQIFQPAPGVALQRSLLPYALRGAERKDAVEDADTNGSEDRGCLVLKKNLKSCVEMMQIVEVPIKVAVAGGGKLDNLQDFSAYLALVRMSVQV